MVNGIIVQLAEDFVTELLVERKRLKIESIQMRVETTATTRLALGYAHESPAEPASLESACNPELFDEQPVPPRVAEQAADNISLVAR